MLQIMTNIISACAAGLLLVCAGLSGSTTAAFAQAAAVPQAAPAPQDTPAAGETLWVTTTQRVKTKLYQGAQLSAHPVLVIVVHGDSPDEPPTYQYQFAQRAAAALPDAVVAAVLRPGYEDGEDASDGMRGITNGDNWAPEIVNAVATVLSELKDRFHPRHVILVGHSGGAAIAADLLAQRGVSVDGALLVSCPCDVAQWRKHMQETRGGAIWQRPVRSLSPQSLVGDLPASVKIWLLVGSDDRTTPQALTLAYADALRQRNIQVDVTIAPGLRHSILLEPIAMDRLKEAAGAIDAGH